MVNRSKNEASPASIERPGGDHRVAEVISGARLGSRELWVEIPSASGAPAAWCYSDKRSYRAGERVQLHLSTNAQQVRFRIYRDDAVQATLHESGVQPGVFHPVPDHAYEVGCDWPVNCEWALPADLPSGGYIVEIRAADAAGAVLGHHLFLVRALTKTPETLLLVAATSTWNAYNDWGGANHYFGVREGSPRGRSPLLSARRPWARGLVWRPDDAPRAVNRARPAAPGPAKYEFIEWAFNHGHTKYSAVAGWATYERHFVLWAEANGYQVDIVTQDDLHPEGQSLLAQYPCAVFIGHDEYWSREMRVAVDGYVDAGGNVARFAGNFLWQIRLEDEGQRQVTYKYDARALDPVAGTADQHLLTSAWEDPLVGYPGAATFGVNALRGMYAAYGGMARRAARGFNVFRHKHWSFEGTGLGYADMFGDEAGIFGFEMDGLDYSFEDGLPVPAYTDGAPQDTEILAMGWATLVETGLPQHDYSFTTGDADARFRASVLSGDMSPESIEKFGRGSGMVVAFQRGRGEVYTAGTCEWVAGLIQRDFFTERITKNVLNRFTARA